MPETPKHSLGQIGLENFSPYLMNRIMARYNESLRAKMDEQGLTTPKMRVLATLSVIDAPTTGALAVYAIVENSTLSRALDGLEEDELVQRTVDKKDGRSFRVSITDKGRAMFEDVWPYMHQSYEAMFKGISVAERHAFVGTLKTVLRNIRKHDF